ncbi:MAG: DUF1015 domain-containing protein [Isosphaeraceae bacterium]|nr:DUF1015 domain-containing protein [Isosphaeraceae bacterium]
MPDIRPFRGLRYDMAQVGALSDVVAPPYDVIDASLQDRLYDASPYNVVRLELNRDEPDDAPGRDRHSRAARFLKEWLRSGILRPESHPALYVYHQIFSIDGRECTRRAFFARLRVEPFGSGRIHPHEQTLPGPKADRLALYRATDFNLSPIFGLYPDPTSEVQNALEAGIVDRTPMEAVDHLGVIHRLWPVEHSATHSTVQKLIGPAPVFIADGHHRYETALAYRDERAAALGGLDPDDPANFCLAALVGMSDPGLIIQPTHRLVSGFPGLTAEVLAARLAGQFAVEFVGEGDEGTRSAWESIEINEDQDILGFATTADNRRITARLLTDERMDALCPEHGPEWRSLGVSVLHELVFRDLLGDLGAPSCRYVHRLDEVVAATRDPGVDLACLVPPATMDLVENIASNHEKMPPKSTYFYPKLLTGLVLNPLK